MKIIMTKVVNIRKDDYDVYIGRAGKGEVGYYGNPFRIGFNESRESIIEDTFMTGLKMILHWNYKILLDKYMKFER